ncbi:MAG: DNA replication/repair protein RecF [Xanthomonadales bacterium]|nr:DNA replication/repair protein RecF [Xanthomonadales bacterium]
MIIRKLRVENLRNLASVELEPHASFNYIQGENGAGKTSVLESITVLSRGRSFRTSQATDLTGPRERKFRVFAEVCDEQGSVSRLGLERAGTHWRGRLNSADVKQLSQLTRRLPIVLLEPDSHLLVSGPPEIRRKYLDWGMFHVEHGFLDVWRRYSKALKQRNAALRRGRVELLDSLDSVLAECGNRLSQLRSQQVDRVHAGIGEVLEKLKTRVGQVEMEYQKGWGSDTLHESLVARRETDLERGMTWSGPHRGDIKLTCGGIAARVVLSRGEQKAFAAAMVLIQAELLKKSGQKPVFLCDDLESEFDEEHFDSVLNMAVRSGAQVWVTGTGKPQMKHKGKVFHVEQGVLRELL